MLIVFVCWNSSESIYIIRIFFSIINQVKRYKHFLQYILIVINHFFFLYQKLNENTELDTLNSFMHKHCTTDDANRCSTNKKIYNSKRTYFLSYSMQS